MKSHTIRVLMRKHGEEGVQELKSDGTGQAVPVLLYSTPKVRLWFPDADAVNGPLIEEFMRVAHSGYRPENSAKSFLKETFEELLTRSIVEALRSLGLPLVAELLVKDTHIQVNLDVSPLLLAKSPTVSLH